ncbi:hypothetical protein PCE1_000386 [Barthelona sp. PCE]
MLPAIPKAPGSGRFSGSVIPTLSLELTNMTSPMSTLRSRSSRRELLEKNRDTDNELQIIASLAGIGTAKRFLAMELLNLFDEGFFDSPSTVPSAKIDSNTLILQLELLWETSSRLNPILTRSLYHSIFYLCLRIYKQKGEFERRARSIAVNTLFKVTCKQLHIQFKIISKISRHLLDLTNTDSFIKSCEPYLRFLVDFLSAASKSQVLPLACRLIFPLLLDIKSAIVTCERSCNTVFDIFCDIITIFLNNIRDSTLLTNIVSFLSNSSTGASVDDWEKCIISRLKDFNPQHRGTSAIVRLLNSGCNLIFRSLHSPTYVIHRDSALSFSNMIFNVYSRNWLNDMVLKLLQRAFFSGKRSQTVRRLSFGFRTYISSDNFTVMDYSFLKDLASFQNLAFLSVPPLLKDDLALKAIPSQLQLYISVLEEWCFRPMSKVTHNLLALSHLVISLLDSCRKDVIPFFMQFNILDAFASILAPVNTSNLQSTFTYSEEEESDFELSSDSDDGLLPPEPIVNPAFIPSITLAEGSFMSNSMFMNIKKDDSFVKKKSKLQSQSLNVLSSSETPPMSKSSFNPSKVCTCTCSGICQHTSIYFAILKIIFRVLITSHGTLESNFVEEINEARLQCDIVSVLVQHFQDPQHSNIVSRLCGEFISQRNIGAIVLLRLVCPAMLTFPISDDLIKIGEGGYGAVFSCPNAAGSTRNVCVKLSNQSIFGGSAVFARAFGEIVGLLKAMDQYKHYGRDERADIPCTHLYDFGIHQERICIVIEQYRTSLHHWRQRAENPSFLLLLRIFYHIVMQCCTIAERGLVHFDLKLDNILISAPASVSDEDLFNAKVDDLCFTMAIGDFGEALPVSAIDDDEFFKRNRGTEVIRSPEMLFSNSIFSEQRAETFDRLHRPSPLAADVWSIGLLLYELFTGNFLFDPNDVSHMYSCVQKDSTILSDEQRATLPPPILGLLDFILNVNPLKRPIMRDVALRVEITLESILRTRTTYERIVFTKEDPCINATPVAIVDNLPEMLEWGPVPFQQTFILSTSQPSSIQLFEHNVLHAVELSQYSKLKHLKRITRLVKAAKIVDKTIWITIEDNDVSTTISILRLLYYTKGNEGDVYEMLCRLRQVCPALSPLSSFQHVVKVVRKRIVPKPLVCLCGHTTKLTSSVIACCCTKHHRNRRYDSTTNTATNTSHTRSKTTLSHTVSYATIVEDEEPQSYTPEIDFIIPCLDRCRYASLREWYMMDSKEDVLNVVPSLMDVPTSDGHILSCAECKIEVGYISSDLFAICAFKNLNKTD